MLQAADLDEVVGEMPCWSRSRVPSVPSMQERTNRSFVEGADAVTGCRAAP